MSGNAPSTAALDPPTITALERVAALSAHEILTQGARELLALGRPDLADALAARAIAEDEGSADAHSVVASIRDARGDWPAALAHLRRAHALLPNAPQVRLNLGLALLRAGAYREGLALYEARLDKPTWSGFATAQSRAASGQLLLRPGDRVDGRRILVLAEQGLGDAIMAARYLPMLAQQGARIVLACNPTLRPFFARMPGIETLLSPPPDQPLAQINLAALAFDAWVPLLSLPYWFGTDVANIPADVPYWTPDAARVAAWRERFARMGGAGVAKIGLVFAANPASANYAERSMHVHDLAPLLALDGVAFLNLQHGPAGRQLADAATKLIDPLSAEIPLDEFAAALAATDLLVSVDTMAVHAAGAMGHPVWIAVPFSPQWTWGLDRATTPWYPAARIFRQTKPRAWADTIEQIVLRLKEDFGATAGAPIRVAAPEVDARAHDRRAAHAVAQTAAALVFRRRPDIAGALAELSLRADAGCAEGHDAMADVLEDAGDWDAAFAHRRAAAASDRPALRLKLALSQLLRGEFADGFANYEARLSVPLWIEQALPLPAGLSAVADRRLRPGDPVRGRRIVVFTEQGLGDTMFGARFLPALAARGAEIALVCRAPTRPLFERLGGIAQILCPPEDAPHAKINLAKLAFDAFCPLLSLPHVLAIGPDVAQVPYLHADPDQVAHWRARYAREGRAGRRKVGLVWRTNPANPTLSARSMKVEDLAPFARLDNLDLINLQHGPEGRELSRVAPHAIDAMLEPLSLDGFAAAVAATDLVVSVDTMAAHCAGALGHPVWVALPNVPAWYWGLREIHSRWYPSAVLFRQPPCSGWSSVVAAVATKLANL
jgi:ADP-heptose:LPS heptosyltransferase